MSSSFDEALTPALASRLASIALGHVRREFPNKPDHVLGGPEDARTPRGHDRQYRVRAAACIRVCDGGAGRELCCATPGGSISLVRGGCGLSMLGAERRGFSLARTGGSAMHGRRAGAKRIRLVVRALS